MTAEPEILRVMPREMRMMTERILSLTALPKGFALMLGDVVMYSEAMGLGGFALLEERLETLKAADPHRLSLAETDSLVLNARGEHAWIVVPSALDLLEEALARAPEARLEVRNVLDPEELGIAAGLGGRNGMEVSVEGGVLVARGGPVTDPVLGRALEEGCRIPAELWWRIYELAQSALTPDSVVSRRHAGPLIVLEDGRVIGRADNDDDTDVTFINSPSKDARRAGT